MDGLVDTQTRIQSGRHTFAVLSAEMGYSKEWLAQMMGVTTGSVEWYYKVTRLKIKDEEDRLGGL